MKREIAGRWNSWPKRATIEITILQSSKWPKILRIIFLKFIKNNRRKKYPRGLTMGPQGTRTRRRRPPVPLFCYMKPYALKIEEDFREEAPLSWGGTWTWAHLLSRGAIPQGILPSGREKSKPTTSPTFLLSWEDSSPSTSSPTPSHLQTLVHLLYSIFVQNLILLVVLITSCSWC